MEIPENRAATIFRDTEAFAESVELLPIGKLIGDLPALATHSQSKFGIAVHVIRRRLIEEAPEDREQLRTAAFAMATEVVDRTVAERIRGIFTSVRAAADD